MYMVIDNTREHKTARCIYDLIIGCIGRMVSFYNLRYSGIFHNNGAIKQSPFVDERSTFNQRLHF